MCSVFFFNWYTFTSTKNVTISIIFFKLHRFFSFCFLSSNLCEKIMQKLDKRKTEIKQNKDLKNNITYIKKGEKIKQLPKPWKYEYLQKSGIGDSIHTTTLRTFHLIEYPKSRVDFTATNTSLHDRIHHYRVQIPKMFLCNLNFIQNLNQQKKLKLKKYFITLKF